MELWVSGFNAWGQLHFNQEKQSSEISFPDDVYTFQNCLQADTISVLWSGISATLLEVSDRVLLAGNPDETMTILYQNPTFCSHIALAGNDKISVIDNGALRLFDSLHDFKVNNGEYADVGQKFTHVVANQTSFTALSSAREVWTWGDPRFSTCLGREIKNERPASVPCRVEDLCHLPTGPIKKVSSGGYMSAALTEGNDLYIWGGRLGQPEIIGGLTDYPTPVDLDGRDIIDFAVGFNHILALTSDRRLFTVGFGDYGQLGSDLRRLHQWKEVILSLQKHQQIIRVYAGYKTSFVVTR